MITFDLHKANLSSEISWVNVFNAYNENDPLALFVFLTQESGVGDRIAFQLIEIVVRLKILLKTRHRQEDAIKYIRELTKWNLKEAEDFIDIAIYS